MELGKRLAMARLGMACDCKAIPKRVKGVGVVCPMCGSVASRAAVSVSEAELDKAELEYRARRIHPSASLSAKERMDEWKQYIEAIGEL